MAEKLDTRWIFLTPEGSVFAKQQYFSLGFGTFPRAGKFRVFCSDLTERRIVKFENRRFNGPSLKYRLFGAAYWIADLALSEPVRTYELDELRELAFKANSDLLTRYKGNKKAFQAKLKRAKSFDEIFSLAQDPGVEIDLEATKE